jgi:tartrate-resistant acid phosphatase type 5
VIRSRQAGRLAALPGRGQTIVALAILVVLASAVAAPAEGRQRRSERGTGVTIAVIGDYGTATRAAADVAELVAGWGLDAIVTVGDNYYSSAGGSGTDRYHRAVGRLYCDFLHGVPAGEWCAGGGSPTNRFWPATGNHDYNEAGIASYLAYFDLPGDELVYETVIGPLHVLVLDSHRALRRPREMRRQRAWLRSALGASTAAWRMVVAHHPPYSSGAHGSSPAMRWPFNRWGADLVVAGHDHVYEHLAAEGIPYLVNGLGGAARSWFPRRDPGSVRRYAADWGALRVRATDRTLDVAFVTVSGGVEDSFALSRPSARPQPFAKTSPGHRASALESPLRLRWEASTEAYSYETCVDRVIDGRCSSRWRNAGQRTGRTLRGLPADTVHEWQVRAVGPAGRRAADRGAWRRFTTAP